MRRMFTPREENLCLPETGPHCVTTVMGTVHTISVNATVIGFKTTADNMLMLWIITQDLVLLWAALFGTTTC